MKRVLVFQWNLNEGVRPCCRRDGKGDRKMRRSGEGEGGGEDESKMS